MWEYNACVRAFNIKQQNAGKEQLAASWQTANFTGAAFGGKLKPLKHYLKDDTKKSAPNISRDEFERRLKAAKEGGRIDGA